MYSCVFYDIDVERLLYVHMARTHRAHGTWRHMARAAGARVVTRALGASRARAATRRRRVNRFGGRTLGHRRRRRRRSRRRRVLGFVYLSAHAELRWRLRFRRRRRRAQRVEEHVQLARRERRHGYHTVWRCGNVTIVACRASGGISTRCRGFEGEEMFQRSAALDVGGGGTVRGG